MKLYNVIFKENGKSYIFKGKDGIKEKEYVIVETDQGEQYGQIQKVLNTDKYIDEYKSIIRVASKEDKNKYLDILKENSLALKKCRELVTKMNLKMNVISADFSFDKKQLLFSFVSEERIDFRELAKKLASLYHTRIELRQIGARDKAKEIGGIGVCGERLCCTRFLNKIDAISMNMAKDQNLALNPSKINGLCGRLLCCLQYEDEEYQKCLAGMPQVGDDYETSNGKGKVISVDILNRKIKVLNGSIKEEIVIGEKNGHRKK